MNYRHAYHAGNFADVLKHLVLVHVINYLARKDKAFRVIDTHGGIGEYDLAGIEAGNSSSIRLHERLGFTRVGLMPHVGTKFGRWLDLAFLQLTLDAREVPDEDRS